MAKGNTDGAIGAWLRSGPETQMKRIDAITTLFGDQSSTGLASLRMQSKTPRNTVNPLQQTATREALKFDAWIGIDPQQIATLASSFGGDSNPSLATLGNLRGLSIGVYLRDQIRIEAILETPSPGVAARLLAAYQKERANDPAKSQTWMVAEESNLRFTEIVDARHLKAATAFDPTVAQIIGPQIASLIQSLEKTKPESADVAAKTPAGRTVIQGLDGGPKEIHLR